MRDFFWRLLCTDMQSHLELIILEEDIGFLSWSSYLESAWYIGWFCLKYIYGKGCDQILFLSEGGQVYEYQPETNYPFE